MRGSGCVLCSCFTAILASQEGLKRGSSQVAWGKMEGDENVASTFAFTAILASQEALRSHKRPHLVPRGAILSFIDIFTSLDPPPPAV
jgi:hypothetical protein